MITVATRETAETIIEVLSHGLSSGLGSPVKGQMCVEAAVCYAMGLPHSDEPVCVSPAIRAFKIRLNDCSWSSNIARADGMRRLAIAQLNSARAVDDEEFARRLIDLAIREIVPFALRQAASVSPDQGHKDELEAAAVTCKTEGTKAASKAAAYAAANAVAYASYAANAAAYAANAANAAAYAAANAVAYASYAANAAAYAASYAANAAADAAARDEYLSFVAEEVVQILIDMKAPGTEWLDLAPLQTIAA